MEEHQTNKGSDHYSGGNCIADSGWELNRWFKVLMKIGQQCMLLTILALTLIGSTGCAVSIVKGEKRISEDVVLAKARGGPPGDIGEAAVDVGIMIQISSYDKHRGSEEAIVKDIGGYMVQLLAKKGLVATLFHDEKDPQLDRVGNIFYIDYAVENRMVPLSHSEISFMQYQYMQNGIYTPVPTHRPALATSLLVSMYNKKTGRIERWFAQSLEEAADKFMQSAFLHAKTVDNAASFLYSRRAPLVKIETALGVIVLELDKEKAPKTVENFLSYVDDGFYDGLIFHRVIPGFMCQGGSFTPEMQQMQTRGPIQNEANNGLKNVTGSIAMARTKDPHSANTQFFVNINDNTSLDHREQTPNGWGYAVFGRVVRGMDIVKTIVSVPTTRIGTHNDVPREPIVMTRVTRITASE